MQHSYRYDFGMVFIVATDLLTNKYAIMKSLAV